jgi:hypothetical protein
MPADRDTIFALSSGRPPAAIAIVRISGPRAGEALKALCGKIPEPRRAAFARVRDPKSGDVIDEAIALWFPAPASETGEDVARRIRKVLQHCPAERVTLNPDCGFGWSPRYMCNQKLASLVAGARLVRAELTGRK